MAHGCCTEGHEFEVVYVKLGRVAGVRIKGSTPETCAGCKLIVSGFGGVCLPWPDEGCSGKPSAEPDGGC
jgi:hypothetical protein